MRPFPKVSIIILNWNGWRDTIECLESLTRIAYPNFEITVVDNGSTDASKKRLQDWIDKHDKVYKTYLIINRRNLGFAEGNNVAIRRVLAKGESGFILLLNNDTVVKENFLNELIEVARDKEEAGILGPKIYYFDYQGQKNVIQSAGSKVDLCRGKFLPIEPVDRADEREIKEASRSVDFVAGTCLLIRTQTIKQIGLLDKKYFANFEDADWCLRARKAGYLVLYVPGSIIWHKVSQSFRKEKGRQLYLYTRNLFWFELKYAGTLRFPVFILNYFVFIFPKYFLGYLLLKRSYGLWQSYLRGIKDGVKR